MGTATTGMDTHLLHMRINDGVVGLLCRITFMGMRFSSVSLFIVQAGKENAQAGRGSAQAGKGIGPGRRKGKQSRLPN